MNWGGSETLRLLFMLAPLGSIGFAACAQASEKFNVAQEGSRLRVDQGELAKSFQLRHLVDGYEVDCDKRYLVVWGKPEKINPSNPQDTGISLINLTDMRFVYQGFSGKNIYDAEYVDGGRALVVFEDVPLTFDLASGKKIQGADAVDVDSPSYKKEQCPDFKFRSYRKYSE